jgi:hypothetical protein
MSEHITFSDSIKHKNTGVCVTALVLMRNLPETQKCSEQK